MLTSKKNSSSLQTNACHDAQTFAQADTDPQVDACHGTQAEVYTRTNVLIAKAETDSKTDAVVQACTQPNINSHTDALLDLIDKLAREHSLTLAEYEKLLCEYDADDAGRTSESASYCATKNTNTYALDCAGERSVSRAFASDREHTPPVAEYAASLAREQTERIFGNQIYIRGLIEITNYCKNDCYYCGIRAGNAHCKRYRLNTEEILECANRGYDLGFRTFVLQGGEDPHFNDELLTNIISQLNSTHPDCCITLSLGQRSLASYKRLRVAGAKRYLLRHETANAAHYARIHPTNMSYSNRLACLQNLRTAGFSIGAGFMVGSPYQTPAHLAQDLKFIESLKPEMCGIGPYIPHSQTPFARHCPGKLSDVLFCLSLIRLATPDILLPATTALAALDKSGRERGILAGANVIMPNLSPARARKNYNLYKGKPNTQVASAKQLEALREQMFEIDREIVVDRGDPPALSTTC